MDVYKFPELQQYWGLGGSLIVVKEIAESISYSKFTDIRNSITIEDENYLIQQLCKQSLRMINPSQDWSIDEQLRLFTGRYINKVVMKDKPAGCGIKCIGMANSNNE